MNRMFWCLLLSSLSLVASAASAQIQPRAFKLGLETNLLSFTSDRVSEGNRESKTKTLAFGPAEHEFTGWNLGVVVARHLIIGGELGFARRNIKNEPGQGTTRLGVVEVRPQLEFPFDPSRRFVFGALVAFDYLHRNNNGPKLNGYGPAVGLVGHGFLMSRASLDLAALFRYLVLEREHDANNIDRSLVGIQFTAGLSFWL